MASIFGFYFVVKLLEAAGWPRRRSLINSDAVVNTLVLDSAIDQMIDWAACVGANNPKLGLQILATMQRDKDWDSEEAPDFVEFISESKKLWKERGDNKNPREAVKPVRLSNHDKLFSMKNLKSKDFQIALETYCMESLIWGLVNSQNFNSYYRKNTDEQQRNSKKYENAGINVNDLPTLEQFSKDGEEVIKRYENEIRQLQPIPQRLLNDMVSLGIDIEKSAETN